MHSSFEIINVLLCRHEFDLQFDGNCRDWSVVVPLGHDPLLQVSFKTLELLMSIVKNLMTSAGEAAYLSGAEYAGISAGERLHSAERHVAAMSESEAAKAKLQEIEVRSIDVETKHAENKERQKKKKENDSKHVGSDSKTVHSESKKETLGSSAILDTSNEDDSL